MVWVDARGSLPSQTLGTSVVPLGPSRKGAVDSGVQVGMVSRRLSSWSKVWSWEETERGLGKELPIP